VIITSWTRNRWIGLAFAFATAGIGAIEPAASEELWFAPQDNLVRFGKRSNEDFPRLFDKASEWPKAASHTKVIDLTSFYFMRAADPDLRATLDYLGAHRIALNVSILALPAENCGRGVEGILPDLIQTRAPVIRLKQLNADVASFGFDEPLEYGHIYKGRAACNFPVGEVAKRVAMTVREARSLYPEAKFIDYEVPQDLPLAEWTQALNEWLSAYQQATGTPLDGFAIDAHFREAWEEPARRTIDILHSKGVKAGIFLNAPGGPNVTDESWMMEAKQNILKVLAAKLPLDFVVITTWVGHPSRNVPETDPLALTSLINWYAEHRVVGR